MTNENLFGGVQPLVRKLEVRNSGTPIIEQKPEGLQTPPLLITKENLADSIYMPIYHNRLVESTLYQQGNIVLGASLRLWISAWRETPPGSIPNDNAIGCVSAGFSLTKDEVSQFLEVRETLFQGWEICSDNRIYHPYLCEVAATALNSTEVTQFVRKRESVKKNKNPEDETLILRVLLPLKLDDRITLYRPFEIDHLDPELPSIGSIGSRKGKSMLKKLTEMAIERGALSLDKDGIEKIKAGKTQDKNYKSQDKKDLSADKSGEMEQENEQHEANYGSKKGFQTPLMLKIEGGNPSKDRDQKTDSGFLSGDKTGKQVDKTPEQEDKSQSGTDNVEVSVDKKPIRREDKIREDNSYCRPKGDHTNDEPQEDFENIGLSDEDKLIPKNSITESGFNPDFPTDLSGHKGKDFNPISLRALFFAYASANRKMPMLNSMNSSLDKAFGKHWGWDVLDCLIQFSKSKAGMGLSFEYLTKTGMSQSKCWMPLLEAGIRAKDFKKLLIEDGLLLNHLSNFLADKRIVLASDELEELKEIMELSPKMRKKTMAVFIEDLCSQHRRPESFSVDGVEIMNEESSGDLDNSTRTSWVSGGGL